MKTCYSCGEDFPLDHFYRDKTKKDGRTPYCRKCRKEKAAAQYQKNPQLAKDRAHKARAEQGIKLDLRRMGMSIEEYASLLVSQNYKCAICGEEEKVTQNGVVRRLSVDHDHECCSAKRDTCGKCTRGLLCQRCNLMIGKANDDIEILMKAVEYLRAWSSLTIAPQF